MKTKKNTKSAKPTTKTKAAPRAPKLIDAIGAGELDNVTGGASVPYGHLATASGASFSSDE
jgi:hypothetical protein